MHSHFLSARVISEWSERQAAIHHLLLLLRPGGLWADPLLLQREAPSVLQCWHGPRESHILLPCPPGLCVCVCMCVCPLSRMSYISVHKVAYTARQVTAMETPYPCLTSPLLLSLLLVSFPESLPWSHRRLSLHHHILVVHEVGPRFAVPLVHSLCSVHEDWPLQFACKCAQ